MNHNNSAYKKNKIKTPLKQHHRVKTRSQKEKVKVKSTKKKKKTITVLNNKKKNKQDSELIQLKKLIDKQVNQLKL